MCKKQNFTNEQRNSFNNDLRVLQSKFSDLPKNKHIRHDTGNQRCILFGALLRVSGIDTYGSLLLQRAPDRRSDANTILNVYNVM